MHGSTILIIYSIYANIFFTPLCSIILFREIIIYDDATRVKNGWADVSTFNIFFCLRVISCWKLLACYVCVYNSQHLWAIIDANISISYINNFLSQVYYLTLCATSRRRFRFTQAYLNDNGQYEKEKQNKTCRTRNFHFVSEEKIKIILLQVVEIKKIE